VEGFFAFLESNSIYIVMFIVLIVWLGIFLYMMSADNRLKKIEAELKEIESNEK